jgi:hypothetical protein
VRYGAHTDYQGFTILRPDKSDWHVVEVPTVVALAGSSAHPAGTRVQCGGLEVFHRGSGRWVQVRISKDLNALVVNAGAALAYPTYPDAAQSAVTVASLFSLRRRPDPAVDGGLLAFPSSSSRHLQRSAVARHCPR